MCELRSRREYLTVTPRAEVRKARTSGYVRMPQQEPSPWVSVNAAQRGVLEWIAEGCPPDRFEGYKHRTSAAALKSRGLVTIKGRGPTWQATLPDAGRRYLADPPAPPSNHRTSKRATPQAARKPKPAEPLKTEALVERLLAADDGVLRLPLRFGRGGPTTRQRAYAAQAAGRLPTGKGLTTRVIGKELEIRLIAVDPTASPRRSDQVDQAQVALTDVPVPTEVDDLHRVAVRFRDAAWRHEVSETMLDRATRIVHAIAVEAERRGWKVQPVGNLREPRGARSGDSADGHLKVTAKRHTFHIRMQEHGVHRRSWWEGRVESDARWSSFRNPNDEPATGPYDADATGRLKLTIAGGHPTMNYGRQSTWSDLKKTPLEQRLAPLFREIETRIIEFPLGEEKDRERERQAAEDARLAAERAEVAARERERQWHLHVETAKPRLIAARKATELRAQERAWREAQQLREYCDAMEARHGDDPATAEWLTWSRDLVERLDPLTTPPRTPADPEISARDLDEHMPAGWSAYGPTRSRYGW